MMHNHFGNDERFVGSRTKKEQHTTTEKCKREEFVDSTIFIHKFNLLMPTKPGNHRVDRNKRRIDPNKRRQPPDWTEQDTQLIQYSILTKTLPRALFSAILQHSGEPVLGHPQSHRRIFARELRQRLSRSLQSFQIGISNSQLWKELPQNYDPSDYISYPDGTFILPLSEYAYQSQFLTNSMVKTNRKQSVSPMKNASGVASCGASAISEAAMAIKMDLGVPYISGQLRDLTNKAVMEQLASRAPTWSTFGTASKSLGGTVITTMKAKIEEGVEVFPFLSFAILDQHVSLCTDFFAARLFKVDAIDEEEEDEDTFLFVQVPVPPPDAKMAMAYLTRSLESLHKGSSDRTQYYRACNVAMEKESFRVYAIKFEGILLHNDLLQEEADTRIDGGLTVREFTRYSNVDEPGFTAFDATVLDVCWEIPIVSDEMFDIGIVKAKRSSAAELAAKMAQIKLEVEKDMSGF